jgi:hypothetical protein
MRTTAKSIAGILALALAATPGAVIAQAGDAEDMPVPAYWTSIEERAGAISVDPNPQQFDWGYRSTTGFKVKVTGDDPRVAGDIDVVFTHDRVLGQDIGRGLGIARLVNDGGSWVGPVHVLFYPDGSEFRFIRLEGQGGYEGLTLLETNFVDSTGREQPQGLIWEGEVPLPDLASLPD